MKKVRKSIFISVTLAVILGSIISCACSQSSLDDKALKKVLREKAGLDFKDKLNIKSFESQQSVGADYFERYEIELSQSQAIDALLSIRTSNKMGWEKIEKGYDLLNPNPSAPPPPTAEPSTFYIFTLDTTDNSLEVQIGQE